VPFLLETPRPKHLPPVVHHPWRLAGVLAALCGVLSLGVGLVVCERSLRPSGNWGVVGLMIVIGVVLVARDAIRAAR
jgi:drug/metabolite transporter (DMT)-like permease